MDCSLPGSCIHEISQARILEWVAISFSRRSSQPRDWTWLSHIVGRRFIIQATKEVHYKWYFLFFSISNKLCRNITDFNILFYLKPCFGSVQFSRSLVSDSLWPHGLQHARLPCPSPNAQTHVHQVSDAIQPFHLLSSPSPPAFNLSQHQGLFQWVSSLHQVAKVLDFQLQPQSFQWTFRIGLL